MENIIDRIDLIAHNEGIKITSLERKIGASKGVLSRALNNKTDIQSKWITKIVDNYPSYNPEWLLTGKGSMLKHNYEMDVLEDPLHKRLFGESEIKYNKKHKEEEKTIHLLQDHLTTLKENNTLLKDKISTLEKELILCKKNTNPTRKQLETESKNS